MAVPVASALGGVRETAGAAGETHLAGPVIDAGKRLFRCSHEAKADVIEPADGKIETANRRPAVLGAIVPATAAKDAV